MSSLQSRPNRGAVVDNRRSRRLHVRYRERARKLRTRAMAMISTDTRQVMLGIADYLQRMADRLEASGGRVSAPNTPPAD